jgi:hypothetical protein
MTILLEIEDLLQLRNDISEIADATGQPEEPHMGYWACQLNMSDIHGVLSIG